MLERILAKYNVNQIKVRSSRKLDIRKNQFIWVLVLKHLHTSKGRIELTNKSLYI